MKYLLLLFLTVSISSKELINTSETEARIYYSVDNQWTILTENFDETKPFVAKGFYNDIFDTNGWDKLAITTNSQFNDDLQAEAAGRLEGYLSKDRILMHYHNVASFTGDLTDNEKEFFQKQFDFIKSSYEKTPENPHIYNAHLVYLQFKGMVDEYNKQQVDEANKISEIEFNIMTAFGDMIEIHEKFKTNSKAFDEMNYEELKEFTFLHSHCSAIFKAKEDLTNVFMAHNSWYYYSMMNRIFKEYNLNFNHYSVKAKSVLFSSYSASLSSNDDFYVTSNDLNVIETTNMFFNKTFYQLVEPESLLTWQRVIIANRMSVTAKEWSSHFGAYNSGTYNNMYMVLDMKNILIEEQTILNETLFTVEQIPKLIKTNDVTNQLKYGYWPSYNTPYDKEIIELSNITGKISEIPDMKYIVDYDICTRATIMRRDQSKIKDIESLKTFIKYNNFTKDKLALNDSTA